MAPAKIKSIMEISGIDENSRANLHAVTKSVRETCPAFRDEEAKSWLLTRFDDIRSVVNDQTMWRGPARAEKGSLMRGLSNDDQKKDDDSLPSILFLDEPDHSRIRKPLAGMFYKRINAMKSEIHDVIDQLMDKAPAHGSFDVISEIAIPIPIMVIGRILGVEETRLHDFRKWSEAAILSLNPMPTPAEVELIEWGSQELRSYFTFLMDERRSTKSNDLISDMIKLQEDGTNITDDELRTNLQALLIGGNLTTTDLIANAILLLLQHPGELDKFRNNSELASAVVEETLRVESPVGVTTRVVPDDRTIAGCPMHASQPIWVSLHSANRDASQFDDPDRFNITREKKPHVAFGGGTHICIGAPLARLEAQHVLLRFFEKYPNAALPEQNLQWRSLPFFRGLEQLVVEAGTP